MLSTTPHAEVILRPDGTPFAAPVLVWSEKTELACTLLAEGKQVRHVALECDVSAKAVKTWLRDPDFQARMIEYARAYRLEVMGYGIARVECRVAGYQDTWDRIQKIKKERGEALEGMDVPGGDTGLVISRRKMLGKGEMAEMITEYEVDTPLLREERELLKQAAQDMGQWAEKRVLTGEDGGPIRMQAMALADLLPPEQVNEMIKAFERKQMENGSISVTSTTEDLPVKSSPLPEPDDETFPA